MDRGAGLIWDLDELPVNGDLTAKRVQTVHGQAEHLKSSALAFRRLPRGVRAVHVKEPVDLVRCEVSRVPGRRHHEPREEVDLFFERTVSELWRDVCIYHWVAPLPRSPIGQPRHLKCAVSIGWDDVGPCNSSPVRETLSPRATCCGRTRVGSPSGGHDPQ